MGTVGSLGWPTLVRTLSSSGEVYAPWRVHPSKGARVFGLSVCWGFSLMGFVSSLANTTVFNNMTMLEVRASHPAPLVYTEF